MCQVHTGAFVSLLAPGKTDYTACHPRKTTTYSNLSLRIRTTDASQLEKKNKENKRRNRKEKKRQGSEITTKERKEKRKETRKDKTTRRGGKEKERREKMSY